MWSLPTFQYIFSSYCLTVYSVLHTCNAVCVLFIDVRVMTTHETLHAVLLYIPKKYFISHFKLIDCMSVDIILLLEHQDGAQLITT